MDEVALLLGTVVFRDLEVSTGVRFGGRQRLAVHQLNGGGRVVDVLGRDDGDISISGVFTGSDATLRARQVDEFRASGVSLPLTWDVFFYTVFVREFEADYRNSWWIPYSVRFTVLRDEAAIIVSQVASLVSDIGADAAAAASQALQAGLNLGLGNADAPSISQLTVAQTQVAAATGSVEAGWNLNGIDEATSSASGIAAVAQTTTATQQLAALSVASGYIRRAMINASGPSLLT